jgi:hypothetical protein
MRIDKKVYIKELSFYLDELNASLSTPNVFASYSIAVAFREWLRKQADVFDETVVCSLGRGSINLMNERSKK